MLLIATGKGAAMGVMKRLANAPCEMGVGRGNDHPCGCFNLVFDLDNSSEGMFTFGTRLFIPGEGESLVSLLSDKVTGQKQHSARGVILYPMTGGTEELMTVGWNSAPCPPAFVVNRFALATHRWFPRFTLRLIRIMLLRPDRSVFLSRGRCGVDMAGPSLQRVRSQVIPAEDGSPIGFPPTSRKSDRPPEW